MKSQKSFPLLKLFFVLLIFSTYSRLQAQTPTSLLWEPEAKVTFSTESPWSYSFGIANRSLFNTYLEGEKIAGSNQEHFELNQFTTYRTSANSAVALGFRYRFREAFDDSRYDEFRMIEQFSYSHPDTYLGWGHRFRFEQRFRNVVTIFRLRYQLGISRPLGEKFGVGLSTEFLYSMAEGNHPEADQRFTLEFENNSIENVELSAGVEWRHENYNNFAENNIYLLTGISVKL